MKVKQLINRLSQLDPEAEVIVHTEEDTDEYDYVSVDCVLTDLPEQLTILVYDDEEDRCVVRLFDPKDAVLLDV